MSHRVRIGLPEIMPPAAARNRLGCEVIKFLMMYLFYALSSLKLELDLPFRVRKRGYDRAHRVGASCRMPHSARKYGWLGHTGLEEPAGARIIKFCVQEKNTGFHHHSF